MKLFSELGSTSLTTWTYSFSNGHILQVGCNTEIKNSYTYVRYAAVYRIYGISMIRQEEICLVPAWITNSKLRQSLKLKTEYLEPNSPFLFNSRVFLYVSLMTYISSKSALWQVFRICATIWIYDGLLLCTKWNKGSNNSVLVQLEAMNKHLA